MDRERKRRQNLTGLPMPYVTYAREALHFLLGHGIPGAAEILPIFASVPMMNSSKIINFFLPFLMSSTSIPSINLSPDVLKFVTCSDILLRFAAFELYRVYII